MNSTLFLRNQNAKFFRRSGKWILQVFFFVSFNFAFCNAKEFFSRFAILFNALMFMFVPIIFSDAPDFTVFKANTGEPENPRRKAAQPLHKFKSDEFERLFNCLLSLRRTVRRLLFYAPTRRKQFNSSCVESSARFYFLASFRRYRYLPEQDIYQKYPFQSR